jgi:release factor glutamine methyltransferase
LLKSKLQRTDSGLDLNAMFYGDDVLVEFLTRLPHYLQERGRAIIGLNSLVGIADVIQRANEAVRRETHRSLRFKLLERVKVPLLFYTPSWHSAAADLINEFDRWRKVNRAAFLKIDGQLQWYYEITEVTVA